MEIENMDQFVARATAIKPAAILREFQTVKGFVHGSFGDDFSRWNIHDSHLVPRIAAMQYGGELSLRMDSDVHRKITHLDLPSCWPKGPLIRQQNRAICAQPRQFSQSCPRLLSGGCG